MDKDFAVKTIDELTKLNKEYIKKSNETLNLIRGALCKKDTELDEAYDRGLEDAWEFVKRLVLADNDIDYLTSEELKEIFGCDTFFGVLRKYTCYDAMSAERDYREEQEKKKEAQSFQRGDVVRVETLNKTGIFLHENDEYYSVLCAGEDYAAQLYKEVWKLIKTGEHVDLGGF